MFSKITIGKGQSKYDVIIGEGLCTKTNFQKFVTKDQKILLLRDRNIPRQKIITIKKI